MMKSIGNIILSVWFASASCYEFENLPVTDTPITQVHVAQLFKLCYANTSNPIAITENLAETLHKNLSDTTKAPVIIINAEFVLKNIPPYFPTHPMYILSVSSHRKLFAIFNKLKFAPFWSIQSTFFVIVESVESCEKDFIIFLVVLGQFTLFSCVVLCSNTGGETTLYTYNAFTKRAPDPWIAMNVSGFFQRGRPVTFYKQSFTNDHNMCESLTFDKTEVLDGYPVKVAKMRDLRMPSYFPFLFSFLNITPQVTVFPNDPYLVTHSLRESHEISTLIYDDNSARFGATVPVTFEILYVIVTQKRSFRPVFYETESVFDINGAIGIIIILLLITVLIILHNGYQVRLAILDVLKLLMSMGMDAPLDRLAMKLTFFTAFLFVFIFGPALEGQIFAVLTRPPSQNVETLQDLYDQKYHVYYIEAINYSILQKGLWKTVEEKEYLHPKPSSFTEDQCLELVSEDNGVACIFDYSLILYEAMNKNFYISKKFVFKNRYFLQTCKYWMLGKRFYEGLLYFRDLGIAKRDQTIPIRNAWAKIKIERRREKIFDYQIIGAEDLTNLYIFMAFFQLLAVIIFGIEHIFAYYRRQRR
ncbi:uncharacterized protein LOC130668068 [Microplitis mediator]|uniref:uncharacterized protein LOC130668068 n=1 Tax=Microplitis mediator TaxID=375433 RepID=UPI0025566FED|nr:uncharacterized protein LOC130668068 [Microplitis mediator]